MAHSARPTRRPKAAQPALRPLSAADPGKRSRLLSAAIRIFGRRGYHEARISEIAAEAGVAEGTVYLYFRSKEDLLGSVFDETMDAVLAEGRRIAASPATAAERLALLVDGHIALLAGDRDLASVFQIELRRSARLVERFSRSKLVEYFRLLGGVLKEGIASGELRADLDPRLAVRILFGAADELLSEWLLSNDTHRPADGMTLVGTVLRGFGADPAPPAAGRGGNSK